MREPFSGSGITAACPSSAALPHADIGVFLGVHGPAMSHHPHPYHRYPE
jgi:hypothetical protein